MDPKECLTTAIKLSDEIFEAEQPLQPAIEAVFKPLAEKWMPKAKEIMPSSVEQYEEGLITSKEFVNRLADELYQMSLEDR
jgi:hypothetical protein